MTTPRTNLSKTTKKSFSLFSALVGGAMLLELVFEELCRALPDSLVELPHALVFALSLQRRPLKKQKKKPKHKIYASMGMRGGGQGGPRK